MREIFFPQSADGIIGAQRQLVSMILVHTTKACSSENTKYQGTTAPPY